MGEVNGRKLGVVDRRPFVAFVEAAHDEALVHVGGNGELLQDVAEELTGTLLRQIGEHHEERLVRRVVAVRRRNLFEQPLVALEEFDDFWHAPLSDLLGKEPEGLSLQGSGHERTHRPGAAEILVGLSDEGLDPVGDGAERIQIAFRELARRAGIVVLIEGDELPAGLFDGHLALLRSLTPSG